MWLERAERIRTQQRHDKNKLYGLHAPEVECISKGKAGTTYEFGVKVSLAVTHKKGLMVASRNFTGNPYDGHILSAQLEQTTNLLQDIGRAPKQAVVDLGYRGVDADNPGVEIIHRGRWKSMREHHKRLLNRRQAIEPAIGHIKADHRMDYCWLHGSAGDSLHALSCAADYNVRWLLRAIAQIGLKPAIFRILQAIGDLHSLLCRVCKLFGAGLPNPIPSTRPTPSSAQPSELGLGFRLHLRAGDGTLQSRLSARAEKVHTASHSLIKLAQSISATRSDFAPSRRSNAIGSLGSATVNRVTS